MVCAQEHLRHLPSSLHFRQRAFLEGDGSCLGPGRAAPRSPTALRPENPPPPRPEILGLASLAWLPLPLQGLVPRPRPTVVQSDWVSPPGGWLVLPSLLPGIVPAVVGGLARVPRLPQERHAHTVAVSKEKRRTALENCRKSVPIVIVRPLVRTADACLFGWRLSIWQTPRRGGIAECYFPSRNLTLFPARRTSRRPYGWWVCAR